MALGSEGRAGEFGVVSDDHKRLEIDHVECVICEQCVERPGIAALVVVSEQDGEEAVDIFEALTRDAQLLLATLETTAVAEAAEDVTQVDGGLVEPGAQATAHKGRVEGLPIVGDQQPVGSDVAHEVVEVVALDIGAQIATVVEHDGGDMVFGVAQAGGLYIEVGDLVAEGGEETPLLGGGQQTVEIIGVASLQLVGGLADVAVQGHLFSGAQGQIGPPVEVGPTRQAETPQRALGAGAETGYMAISVFEHGIQEKGIVAPGQGVGVNGDGEIAFWSANGGVA